MLLVLVMFVNLVKVRLEDWIISDLIFLVTNRGEQTCKKVNYLKIFLKRFPGDNLLSIEDGLVGVCGD